MMKTKFRKSLKHKLSLMSEIEVIKSSAVIQLNCLNYIKSIKHENVLIYMAFKSEVRTDVIKDRLLFGNKKIFIPKVLDKNTLSFNKYSNEESLVENEFKILESLSQEFLVGEKFDLIILPLIGIDKNGSRLGYGGGYYDRALQDIRNLDKRPTIIGLGYEFQILNEEFGESHDIKFDIAFTEQKLHIF